jgi:hypothetical protein
MAGIVFSLATVSENWTKNAAAEINVSPEMIEAGLL